MSRPDLEGETGGSDLVWCLLVGPGPRLMGLEALLAAAAPAPAPSYGKRVDVRALGDAAELLEARWGPGRLVLDARELDPEDVGIVRRFLAADRRRSLAIFASEDGPSSFPSLAEHEQVHWLAWPPDVDLLRALARAWETPLPQALPPRSRTTSPAPSSPGSPAGTAEPPAPLSSAAAARAASEPEREAASAAALLRAPGRRIEVATLADIAQRLQLSFTQVREKFELDPETRMGCQADLERLRSFVRELGGADFDPLPASPPTSAVFDIVALVEEKLAAMSLRGPGTPRYELAGPDHARVLSDRSAIAGALDTFLRLGRRTVGQGEALQVRISVRPEAPAPHVDVSLSCAAGPLERLGRGQLLEPGHIESLLPNVSSQDLRRAVERVEAANGRVDLRSDDSGLLRITLRTSLAPDEVDTGSGA